MYGIAVEYLSVVLVELAETYLSGLRFHGSDYGCGVLVITLKKMLCAFRKLECDAARHFPHSGWALGT
jgi:hypothetical protein